MSGRKMGDQERVLALVQANPGLPQVLIAWLMAGGEIGPEGARGTVELTFPRFVKVNGVSKRVTDLAKRGRIHSGDAKIKTKTSTTGYYPAGWIASRSQRGQSTTVFADQEKAGTGKLRSEAGMAALKAALGDR